MFHCGGTYGRPVAGEHHVLARHAAFRGKAEPDIPRRVDAIAPPGPASPVTDTTTSTFSRSRAPRAICSAHAALECADLNEAIRATLAPHLGGARLTVRFDISRSRFTDSFTRALLHILRELATNAVRHGRASAVRIAGCVERGRLVFSVSDNGCGFDPQHRPGFEEGHFGLLGVQGRIEGYGGDLRIESDGAHGTRVTASMSMTAETEFRKTP